MGIDEIQFSHPQDPQSQVLAARMQRTVPVVQADVSPQDADPADSCIIVPVVLFIFELFMITIVTTKLP